MQNKKMKEKVYHNLLLLLGIVFIISGISKAFNVYAFATEIASFADAYIPFS